jgi:hypothetical protein
MASTQKSRDELNAAIAAVGRQVAADPSAGSGLTADQVGLLRQAGISDDVIGNILREEGLEEPDVAGYATGAETTDPGIIVFTKCVLGTCKGVTIVVGCTISVPPIS